MSRQSKFLLLVTTAAGALVSLPDVAMAQEQAGPSETQSARAPAGNEIIVTATKRETSLQKTSESIQVLTADQLAATGTASFDELFTQVPNLSQSDSVGPGNKRYSVRGIASGGEPLVSVYYDDAPALGSPGETLDPGGSQPDLLMVDLERVEVLKGPQGTLYGNGSAGGTIRFITKKADLEEFSVTANGRYGFIEHGGNSYQLDATVNVPIVEDVLAVRLTGYNVDDDGYIDEFFFGEDDANTTEIVGGRLNVVFEPTPELRITSTTFLQKTETGGNFEIFEGFGSEDDPTAGQLTRTPFEDEILLTTLTAEYELGGVDLFYTFSYQDREVRRFDDQTRFVIFGLAGLPPEFCPNSALLDGSCYDLINAGPFGTVVPANSFSIEKSKSTVHEFRMVSDGSGPFRWTLGAYYEDRENVREGQVAVADGDGNLVFNPDGSAQGRIFARTNVGAREQISVFGDAEYDITDSLTLGAGLRWFNTDRQEDQNLIQNFGPGPTGMQPTESASESGVSPRFKISYEPSDDVLIYGLVAQGFRIGGPNQPVGFDASAPGFDSDELWNYEIGVKSTIFDGLATANLAAFYIDWSDVQYVTSTADGTFTIIGNAGDAEVKGFEFDLRTEPSDGLEIVAGIGYADAKFAGDQPVQGLIRNQTRDGDRLPGVPKWSTNLFVQQTFDISDDVSMWVNGDWSYRSNKTTGLRPEAGDFRVLGGYNLVNARVGIGMDAWSFSLEVYNLFDERPQIAGRVVDNDPFKFSTLPPRTISLSASVSF